MPPEQGRPKSPSEARSRQIRALYDSDTITVYQAYNTDIATAAVRAQRLDASPLYNPSRMTWIKPSWNWMMYRSDYSYKDANQSNILALKISRAYFDKFLMSAVLSESGETKRDGKQVRVQWDPERDIRTEKVSADGRVRSIQIGIPMKSGESFIREGIVSIEDVTEIARKLKKVLCDEVDVNEDELKRRGLIPDERVYTLPEEVAKVVEITPPAGAVE